jgi:hypothetical protein
MPLCLSLSSFPNDQAIVKETFDSSQLVTERILIRYGRVAILTSNEASVIYPIPCIVDESAALVAFFGHIRASSLRMPVYSTKTHIPDCTSRR